MQIYIQFIKQNKRCFLIGFSDFESINGYGKGIRIDTYFFYGDWPFQGCGEFISD